MKIAIITITDGMNYGNRLQNYALQTVLESCGHSAETIMIRSSRNKSRNKEFIILIKDIVKKCLFRKDTNFMYRHRRRKFDVYNKKYIQSLGKSVLPKEKAIESLHDYDCVICGSDQIWNINYDFVLENIEFYLGHGAEKKVAYAASFGISELPDKMYGLFRDELKTFQAIGVREDAGKRIVNDLGIMDHTQVVLDPTMLLTTEEWKNMMTRPKHMNENSRYVLTYFLSGRNNAINSHIENISNDLDANVVNLEIEYLRDDEIENRQAYASDPREFLWLIANAQAVLTDSFHAVVFSILFHKPFVVYQRKTIENKNNIVSRIETLLKQFDLQKYIDDIDSPGIYPEQYNGKMIEAALENDRQQSLGFLKDVLSEGKENEY